MRRIGFQVSGFTFHIIPRSPRPPKGGVGSLSRDVLRFTFLALLFTLPVFAQDGVVTDDQVNAVARQLNCPVCENTPLDVCDTPACVQWRELIRQKLAAGETPEQIMAYFHETYGDRVLQEPPRHGLSFVLWVLPLLGVVAAGLILWLVLRSMSPVPVEASEPPGQDLPAGEGGVLEDYRQRLERELEEM
jgi:cytochrome c-type biogenesis protein CcmH